MLILQALAKFILKWFKKIAVFWAEKRAFRAELAASNAVSWCRKNSWKAYRTPAKAALQGSFDVGPVLLPKMQLNAAMAVL